MAVRAKTEANQATLSEHNRSRLIQHLYHNGICSRAQIAKALQLTPAAITKITARLIDAGMINETGQMEGDRNRRSIGLELDNSKFHVIGVKFARSLVEIGVFDLAGNRIHIEDLPTVDNSTIPHTITVIHSTIKELISQDPKIVAVGMAVPGPYLRDGGHTAVVSSMQEWRSVNFIDEFAHAFPVPVFIEQDARAGVLAQHLFDPDSDVDNLAYYLLGEGIGLGVINNGEVINGAQGAATEVGHISVDVNGLACECGNHGCLERYCSAVAIHEELNKRGDLVPDSEQLTHREACKQLFSLAEEGNKEAQELVENISRFIGYGAVTIFNAYNPERIVIGDIVAQAGEPLLNTVRQVVKERVIPDLTANTTIALSTLPTDAAVVGAAAVAITQFLEHPSQFFDVS